MSRSSLAESLNLTSVPVAIAFVDAVPPGVPRVSTVEPASCGYWRRAASGEVFFTTADDHKRCPVGAHTHSGTAPRHTVPPRDAKHHPDEDVVDGVPRYEAAGER